MARYRYKRGRRYARRSTNVIRMKFQSFMDIRTVPDTMQIISISAGGENLLNRLPAQFSAYKYYMIGNISAKLVPASTLPVDPTGLSYEAGENTVDPRDQLTPGMMRITNGEDVLEDLTGMSATAQHKLYDTMILDPRWFKWMLQRGVKRHATPRYWQIGQLHQDKWPGSVVNMPRINNPGAADQALVGTKAIQGIGASGTSNGTFSGPVLLDSSQYGLFQTGHRGVLGWLPTDGMQSVIGATPMPLITSPPEIEVMKIILPPAYKTSYYYRLYISETCYFKEPILMNASGVFPGDTGDYAPLDIFHRTYFPDPYMPNVNVDMPNATDQKTGGNYGNS